ncbi:hypothetical protein [Brachybacterium aquaticum]|uniref:DUF308 domain-containing protein n=1 Tax=Brachybacterium aquaticum TaxID=1432564 RepID=A0A841AEB1_9MICO|nr:hypothetical protein [Brachybacterium aquaticum]MBB5831622.1 hypothetical protein [Brachybacterium aquaticum]
MSGGRDGRGRAPEPRPDPRDVDAEFARMLEGEGVVLPPGEAPRELAAPAASPASAADSNRHDDGHDDEDNDPWSFSADSPPEPPTQESRERSRAAHPSQGLSPEARPTGPRDATPRELDDDEVIYGDFVAPDPDLPQPSSPVLWSWTALLGGFVLVLVMVVTPSLPGFLGWLGGVAALGGMVSLLLRLPRGRREDGDDGAQV